MRSMGYSNREIALKIVLSLAGAGVVGFGVFVLLEAMLPGAHPPTAGTALFRFQLSSMIAMGVFAGLAVVIYVRLSRRE
jgi:pheromone shutdown protein TraB